MTHEMRYQSQKYTREIRVLSLFNTTLKIVLKREREYYILSFIAKHPINYIIKSIHLSLFSLQYYFENSVEERKRDYIFFYSLQNIL